MSDFGTMALVHRVDGSSTASSDEVLIKRVAKALLALKMDGIHDFADLNLRFGVSYGLDGSQGVEGVTVAITEYWENDNEGKDGLDYDVLIERDRPLAERFGEQLQDGIGPAYRVEVICGPW